ncbi:hypothetical conserved protein [Halovirus VNH-1]|uniref:hypothetical protein n=1 Tax=Halovirus VNH-1 TaxID=1500510 RepID=UPI0004A88A2F|nr:hypothetical protein MZ08_gp6 [Halovirus VNH-1]AIE08874.1 hypothetical conserved protein [Halovirus VNH-1]
MSASIKTRVNSIAEGLNGDERIKSKDIIEIKYEVTERGDVTEVIAVLTVGGPHIEVECLRGVVSGQWSGETFRRGIESEEVHDYGKMLADRMESRID